MSYPCFLSPIPPEINDEFDVFALARTNDIFNPWPQLADPDSYGQAWSQPFTRSWYVPTTRPDRLLKSAQEYSLPLIYEVVMFHEERIHLAIDTPAKEWARVCLAQTYTEFGKLFDGDISCWYSFAIMNDLFRETCDGIRLSEELLATSLSFRVVEQRLSTSSQKEELDKWEKYCVAIYEKKLQGFSALYYGNDYQAKGLVGGFKKVAQLTTSTTKGIEWPLITRLAIFLEPLNVAGKLPEAIDCRSRCADLAKAVTNLNSARELLAWLEEQITSDDMYAWSVVLGLEAELQQQRDSPAISMLWELVRERKLSQGILRRFLPRKNRALKLSAKVMEEWRSFPAPHNFLTGKFSRSLFYPQRAGDGRWHIRPIVWDNLRDKGGYGMLLISEAFREQLDEGVGFFCPVAVVPDISLHCKCEPIWKEKIQRLAQWAMEGKFGRGASPLAKGQWTTLSFPCD